MVSKYIYDLKKKKINHLIEETVPNFWSSDIQKYPVVEIWHLDCFIFYWIFCQQKKIKSH